MLTSNPYVFYTFCHDYHDFVSNKTYETYFNKYLLKLKNLISKKEKVDSDSTLSIDGVDFVVISLFGYILKKIAVINNITFDMLVYFISSYNDIITIVDKEVIFDDFIMLRRRNKLEYLKKIISNNKLC